MSRVRRTTVALLSSIRDKDCIESDSDSVSVSTDVFQRGAGPVRVVWRPLMAAVDNVQLSDLRLDVQVEGRLPELLVRPDRVLLDAGVGELEHACAQLLWATDEHW